MYVLILWDFDDQTRLSCVSFWPWLLLSLLYFLIRYLLYHPLQLALAFKVCLAGLVLILAAPVDLVLGLMLIVATPQTTISVTSLKCWKCWVFFFFFFHLFHSYIPDYICALSSPHYTLIRLTFLKVCSPLLALVWKLM